MAVSTAIATTAILAYINARYRLPVDWHLLSNHAKALYQINKRLEQNRINCFYLIEEHAQDDAIASKPFLLFEHKRYTFKQVYDQTLRYAGWLHKTYKVTEGEVVAIDFMNSPQFLFLSLAIWSLGATPAFINYNLTGKSFTHSVKTSTARVLIIEQELSSSVLTADTQQVLSATEFRRGAFSLEIVVFDQQKQTVVEKFSPYRAPDKVRTINDGRMMAVLIGTSGTTGLPKQSIVPWNRLFGAATYAAGWQGLRPVTSSEPDVFFTPMPLYHSSAFMVGFVMCLANATTFALSRRFSVSNYWTEVRDSGASVIQYVGETLRYLNNAPPHPDERKHQVRMAFGNGLRPDVWNKFKTRFGVETIAEFYGATEGVASSWNLNRNGFSDGAIGQNGLIGEIVLHNSQAIVKVDWDSEVPWRDPKTGFCVKLPRGDAGELVLQLDAADIEAKFQGYYDNEKATDAKVLRNVFTQSDAWYRTGDVMRWDKDGRLWFSDRIGDTFRWKSENVSTAEVAEILGHHSNIQEANVYGVKVPRHEGRAGCAALVLAASALQTVDGVKTVKPEVLQSIAGFVTESLPRFSVPVFLRVVKRMIVTGNNKQQKQALRSQGIDLETISRGGSGDQIYWMKPDSLMYERFEKQDYESLLAGITQL